MHLENEIRLFYLPECDYLLQKVLFFLCYISNTAGEQIHKEYTCGKLALTQKLTDCLHGGGGPQVGEVTRLGGISCLSI